MDSNDLSRIIGSKILTWNLVLNDSPKDPVRLNRAIQELSASLSIKKILYTVDPS